MTAEVRFPSYISEEAQSLLSGVLPHPFTILMNRNNSSSYTQLLTRDPKLRLGSGHKDGREIKAHPFFKGLDWDKLYRKELTPEFIPQVAGKTCIRNFDDNFTGQPVQVSIPLGLKSPQQHPHSLALSLFSLTLTRPTMERTSCLKVRMGKPSKAGPGKPTGFSTKRRFEVTPFLLPNAFFRYLSKASIPRKYLKDEKRHNRL